MKNIILIIFLVVAFIACESKEEKEFLKRQLLKFRNNKIKITKKPTSNIEVSFSNFHSDERERPSNRF